MLLLAGAARGAVGEDNALNGMTASQTNPCATSAGLVAVGTAQWNGWGRDLDNARYQPEPAIRASDAPRLALKWALDSRSGCTYWTYDAAAKIRTGVSIGELAQPQKAPRPKRSKRKLAHLDVLKAPSAAFFGDDSATVYALDAQKGTLLWRTQIDTHPLARIAGTPIVYRDRLYVAVSSDEQSKISDLNYGCCTFRGSVVALDILNGHVLWKTYTVTEEPRPSRTNSAGVQQFGPAGAPISASPTIDGKREALYVGTGNSYSSDSSPMADAIVALDLTDGRVRWVKQLPVQDAAATGAFDGPPIFRTLATGKQILLAAQESGFVYALDPDRAGEILWQTKTSDAGAGGGVRGGWMRSQKSYAHSRLLLCRQSGQPHGGRGQSGELPRPTTDLARQRARRGSGSSVQTQGLRPGARRRHGL